MTSGRDRGLGRRRGGRAAARPQSLDECADGRVCPKGLVCSPFGQAECVGAGPRGVAHGDLDGDGKENIVLANTIDDNLSVLLNRTTRVDTPSFSTSHAAAGKTPYSVAIANLDHDDKLDLVVANVSDDDVTVLRGDGLGAFPVGVNHGSAPSPRR